MSKMVTIAITILRFKDGFLFLKRRNPPYENLWSLVGGKIGIGEHVPSAAIREVMEETTTTQVSNYVMNGVISERLLDADGALSAHFIIFVGSAEINSFEPNHQEGIIECFTMEEINNMKKDILPSDFEMFMRFVESRSKAIEYHEAELVREENGYHLSYYRDVA
ncbi:MAG: NUDIX domain-containing protein [Candidatus Thorarchaeota archaeon]